MANSHRAAPFSFGAGKGKQTPLPAFAGNKRRSAPATPEISLTPMSAAVSKPAKKRSRRLKTPLTGGNLTAKTKPPPNGNRMRKQRDDERARCPKPRRLTIAQLISRIPNCPQSCPRKTQQQPRQTSANSTVGRLRSKVSKAPVGALLCTFFPKKAPKGRFCTSTAVPGPNTPGLV